MKFSNILFLSLYLCILGGCTKILDKKNLSQVSETDNIWNDADLATAYANRIHANNLPSWNTDYSDYSEESEGGGDYMYGQLTENSVDYWPYDNIREINILIANIDKGTLPDESKKSLKGQALFFRAYSYFEMVKRYGGVPLVLVPQELSDDLLVTRNTTSECMTQIVADLDSAIAFLPEVSAGSAENNGRVHKGTAMALKGRILLFYASPQFDPNQNAAGRWQAAYEANKAAKDYLLDQGFGLYENYAGLWFDEMNKEVIFVKRYEYTPNNDEEQVENRWAAATRPLDVSQGSTGGNRPTLEMVNSFPMKDGRAPGDPASAYTYDSQYYWLNRDPRFDNTIVYNGAPWELGISGRESGRLQWTYVGAEQNSPTPTGFYMKKAVDENQSSIEAYNSSTDWIELRYAEVLLNLAESATEAVQMQEAYPELIEIRKRAGIDAGADNMYGLKASMSQAEMRDAVMFERKIELAYEGKRFWDLRRRRLFESELNGTRRHGFLVHVKISEDEWNTLKASMTSDGLIDYLAQHYTEIFDDEVKLTDTQFDIDWKPEYYFFAIPTEQLQLNSKLEQTMGWSGGTFDPLQ